MKKSSILLICLSLMIALLSACSGNEGNSAKPNNTAVDPNNPYAEPMEISVAYWDVDKAMNELSTDKLTQSILEKFNIKIRPINLTWDDYGQKIQMWAASGQLPDIFAIDAIGTSYQRKWIADEVVASLPEDLSKYPNLQKYMETPDIAGLAVEGKHYTIPRQMFPSVDYSALDRPVYYRWDLAQAAGITKEPETWEEFQAMLAAIVAADPENKNITGLTSSTTKMIGGLFWLYSNPLATSDGSGVDFKWIEEDGKYIPAVFSKNALASLENMKDMFNKGLIDPDIALTSPDIAYDKFAAGKASALLAGSGFIQLDQIYRERFTKSYPDKNYSETIKVLRPLTNAHGDKAHAVFKTYWSESYFSGDIKPEKLERILALYDYVLSEEGNTLLTYGIEGEDYTIENGEIKVVDESVALVEKYKAKGFLKDLVAYKTVNAYDMSNPQIGTLEIRKDAVDFVDYVLNNTTVPDYDIRLTYLSTPTKDSFTVFDHDDLLEVMLSDKPVEQTWNEILARYESKGLSKMIEEVNAEVSKW